MVSSMISDTRKAIFGLDIASLELETSHSVRHLYSARLGKIPVIEGSHEFVSYLPICSEMLQQVLSITVRHVS